MYKLALFASGSGSNAENIIHYFADHKQIEVALILTNNPKAGVLERATRLGTPIEIVEKETFTESTLQLLNRESIDFIVLAGFMNKIPEEVLAAYPERIINIHPALLPKYGGKGMYGMHVHQAAIEAGEKESGITIHHVNEHYDEGAIIFQTSCPVFPDDTPETLATRVHELEYQHFPTVIEQTVITLFQTKQEGG